MIWMIRMIGMVGGWRLEDGDQRSDVGDLMSEVGGRIFGVGCGLNREGAKNAKRAFGCVFRG